MAEQSSNSETSRSMYMLTTWDNPYDPFTQWDEWYAWDMRAGYHTPGLLDRISRLSDELSEVDQFIALQEAIDEIVKENVSGMHKKVKRGDVVVAHGNSNSDDGELITMAGPKRMHSSNARQEE